MRKFDFEHEDFKKHGVDHQQFILANHDKPLTEAEFVEWWTKRPRDGILHASHKRTPSYARHKYQRLVNLYGLFGGPDAQAQELRKG